jgi:hypothetical protein
VAILRHNLGNFHDAHPRREPGKINPGPLLPQETEAVPNSDCVSNPAGRGILPGRVRAAAPALAYARTPARRRRGTRRDSLVLAQDESGEKQSILEVFPGHTRNDAGCFRLAVIGPGSRGRPAFRHWLTFVRWPAFRCRCRSLNRCRGRRRSCNHHGRRRGNLFNCGQHLYFGPVHP